METIKTPSFELAVYKRGNESASKLALMLPGRLDTKDYPHMTSLVDNLAERGYLALSFDPPGTWESPGGIEIYTMTNYLKAINELIAHFGNRPTVLMGHSRGGSMAMLAGMRNDYVTHIIAAMSNPVGSQVDEKTKTDGFQISYRDDPVGGKKMFKVPLNYFVDAAQYDLRDALAHSSKPKLFFAGRRDWLVPPDSVHKTYRLSAPPKQLHEVDCEHDYRKFPAVIAEVNDIIGSFLDR